jgi:alpha-ketoglutaric semialdehyde dehydrogenase
MQRCEILERAGIELAARADEAGRLLAREEGKTLKEAVGEVQRAAHILRFQAQQALRADELYPSTRAGLQVEVTREPVGVVGVIAPWNFPIAIPAWKIAPALAYGNTVVFKPAEKVPGSAWLLVDILQRAGLPPGVLNLVPGPGSEVGQALIDDRRVDAVSFTGSQATGQRVAAACVARAGATSWKWAARTRWWCWTTPTLRSPWIAPSRAPSTPPANAARPPPA